MKKQYKNLMREQVFRAAESGVFFGPDELPARFAELRKALGLTQRQMAKRLGMTQPAYQITEKKLSSSGLRTVQKFLAELNAGLEIRIKPRVKYTGFIRKLAYRRAVAMLDRTYANMALEKQAPDRASYKRRLKETAEELVKSPDSSLWED